MTGPAVSAWRLAGSPTALRTALDRLHVHADVRGVDEGVSPASSSAVVEESPNEVTVYVAGPLPPLPADLGVTVTAAAMPDPDVVVTGLENDRAIVLAPDLVVRPPWVESPFSPAEFRGVELVVPRRNAFGSGEHDSTQAALLLLHELWCGSSTCADVGTGSGILLAYAAARGCPALAGCDIDPVAMGAARELLPNATLTVGGPEVLAPAACVIANLNGQELRTALPAILALWNGDGPLVLSGMRGPAEVEPIRSRVGRPPDRELERGAFTALGYRPVAGGDGGGGETR